VKKLSVCILFGGMSPEHEVSLRSAESVLNHIDESKYNLFPVGITKEGDWILYGGKDYSKLVIADIIKTVGKPSALGSKEVKLRILRKLEEKGVFQLKDSVPQVCELLDISQATLYIYLREIRTQGSGFLPLSQK